MKQNGDFSKASFYHLAAGMIFRLSGSFPIKMNLSPHGQIAEALCYIFTLMGWADFFCNHHPEDGLKQKIKNTRMVL
jgi:hypothetical protein